MRYYTLLIFLISYHCAFTQYKVVNIENNEGIEFTAVYNKSLNIGTYSDKDGYFNLQIRKEDTLVISNVGYYTDTTILTDYHDNTFYLQHRVYNINEVNCTSNDKFRQKEIGFRKEKKLTTFYSHIGSEWVVYIKNPNPNNDILIKSIILDTKNQTNSNIGYKIHLYVCDTSNGEPGAELVALNLYETRIHKGNKYNLEKSIVFPKEGVFVGIEWVSFLNIKREVVNSSNFIELSVPITFNIKDSLTFYRSKFYENKWYKADSNHPLSLIKEFKTPPNLAASLIIKELYSK